MLHIDSTVSYSTGYNGEYKMLFPVPKKIGVYRGLRLPKLHAQVSVTDFVPLNTKVDIKSKFCTESSAMLTLTYPSFSASYQDMWEDFIALKTVVRL